MRTETYKWLIENLSDKESCLNKDYMRHNREHLLNVISNTDNLSKELGGTWNHMTDYKENMETLRNDINSSTNENLH